MPLHRGGPMAWWSPDPRGILPLDGLRVSRSLRRSCRRYEIRVDTAFDEVVRECRSEERRVGKEGEGRAGAAGRQVNKQRERTGRLSAAGAGMPARRTEEVGRR